MSLWSREEWRFRGVSMRGKRLAEGRQVHDRATSSMPLNRGKLLAVRRADVTCPGIRDAELSRQDGERQPKHSSREMAMMPHVPSPESPPPKAH